MMRKVHTLELLIELRSSAGPELEILADENDVEFQERAKRWSDIDREVPAAIILPSSEQEIQLTVQKLLYPPAIVADFMYRYSGLSSHQYRSLPRVEAIAIGPLSMTVVSLLI